MGRGWSGRDGDGRTRMEGWQGWGRSGPAGPGTRDQACRGGWEPPPGAGDAAAPAAPGRVRLPPAAWQVRAERRCPMGHRGRPGPPRLPHETTRGFVALSSLSPQASMDGAPPPASPAGLSAYVVVSQLLGLTLLATTGAWLGRYRGGVAWHSLLQFNVHPLCMVLGMVFLQGDGEQDRRMNALSQLWPSKSPELQLGRE